MPCDPRRYLVIGSAMYSLTHPAGSRRLRWCSRTVAAAASSSAAPADHVAFPLTLRRGRVGNVSSPPLRCSTISVADLHRDVDRPFATSRPSCKCGHRCRQMPVLRQRIITSIDVRSRGPEFFVSHSPGCGVCVHQSFRFYKRVSARSFCRDYGISVPRLCERRRRLRVELTLATLLEGRCIFLRIRGRSRGRGAVRIGWRSHLGRCCREGGLKVEGVPRWAIAAILAAAAAERYGVPFHSHGYGGGV